MRPDVSLQTDIISLWFLLEIWRDFTRTKIQFVMETGRARGCLNKKISYSLETCCGVVLWSVGFGKTVEIKAWEAGGSSCSLFNTLVDHYNICTYIEMHKHRTPVQQTGTKGFVL